MKKENELGCWECKTNELGQTMWEAYKMNQAELRAQLNEIKHLRAALKEKCEEVQKLKSKCSACICQDAARGSSEFGCKKELENIRVKTLTLDKKKQLFEKKMEDEMLHDLKGNHLDLGFGLEDVNSHEMENIVQVHQPKTVIAEKNLKQNASRRQSRRISGRTQVVAKKQRIQANPLKTKENMKSTAVAAK